MPLIKNEFGASNLESRLQFENEDAESFRVDLRPLFVGPLMSRLNIVAEVVAVDMIPNTRLNLANQPNAIYSDGNLGFGYVVGSVHGLTFAGRLSVPSGESVGVVITRYVVLSSAPR